MRKTRIFVFCLLLLSVICFFERQSNALWQIEPGLTIQNSNMLVSCFSNEDFGQHCWKDDQSVMHDCNVWLHEKKLREMDNWLEEELDRFLQKRNRVSVDYMF